MILSLQPSTVVAFPRIHMGLLDLGGATGRSYGGCGFSVAGFPVKVSISANEGLKLESHCELSAQTERVIAELLVRLRDIHPAMNGRVEIFASPPEHVGLGSKTSLLLSVLKALQLANKLSLSDSDLVELSGRGGASGIGVHTFFSGGFVVDAGHPQNGFGLLPSAAVKPARQRPLLVLRTNFPANWRVHMLMPKTGKLVAGAEEVEFFKKNTPVPKGEVLESMAALYHAVLPALLTQDLALLSYGLKQMCDSGFKRREIAYQSSSRDLIDLIRQETELPVGMSSLGPLVYVISGTGGRAAEQLRPLARAAEATYLGEFSATNRGYEAGYE